jgi:hypothetical protein
MNAVVAIDRTKNVRVVFTCSHELREEISAWRAEKRPARSESAAIAELLWQALQRWREERERERKR